ncbi:enoyl-CoA hydratase/isomerase family protein [Bacillaceae bacterium S4-13-58]
MYNTITYSTYKQGGLLILNRPHNRNAVSFEMIEELKMLLQDLKNEPNINYLILTGAGSSSFCSGGDLHEFHPNIKKNILLEKLSAMKGILYDLATFPVPTIALLNGHARGGGCEIASACDYRVAQVGKTFGYVQADLGISTGFGGGSFLYKRISSKQAFDWIMKGKIYTSEELHNVGWIDSLFREEGIGHYSSIPLIRTLEERNHYQLILWKKQYMKEIGILNEDFLEQLSNEIHGCTQLWGNKRHKEAIDLFFRRKK